MSCLTPALHGLGMVVYPILDLPGSDSLLFCTIPSVDIYTLAFRDSPLTIDTNYYIFGRLVK
jgi:hypothetical protein